MAAFTGTLFGNNRNQDALLRIAREGSVRETGFEQRMKESALARSGLVAASTVDGGSFWSLNSRHPAHDELLETLRALLQDDSGFANVPKTKAASDVPLNAERPLAHRNFASFQMLAVLATRAPIAFSDLRESIKEKRKKGVEGSLKELISGGVIVTSNGLADFAPDVPPEYLRLVLTIDAVLNDESSDVNLATRKALSFEHSTDGAPRLFGTDARLRNLMALAKFGPLHLHDLARIVGSPYIRNEDRGYAPFGRGDVVRVWDAPNGAAAALDTRHPVAKELRALLLALERAYPLTTPAEPPPSPRPPRSSGEWNGDKHALFGSPIPTLTL